MFSKSKQSKQPTSKSKQPTSKSKQQTSKSRWDDLPRDLQNVIIQLSNVPVLVNRRLDQKLDDRINELQENPTLFAQKAENSSDVYQKERQKWTDIYTSMALNATMKNGIIRG